MGRRAWKVASLAALLLAGQAGPAPAQRAGGTASAARGDFAHMASGTYAGDLVSDPSGGPRSPARVTVVRTGPNQVRVTSDHKRLPSFSARLARSQDSLRNVDGGAVFLLDLARTPRTLSVTVEGTSWVGWKE